MATLNSGARQRQAQNITGALLSLAGKNTGTFGANVITAPGFVVGTASQLVDQDRDYLVYLQFATAGTALTVSIGPTAAAAYTLVATAACATGEVVNVVLPAGWFLKVEVTTSTLAHQIAISS